LKVLKVAIEKCISCGACEEKCSTLFKKENNREKSCIQVNPRNGGRLINVCNQCGRCIDVCPAEALKRDASGVVRLDAKRCVGCLICVGFCPTSAMRQHDDYLVPFKCISCGQCVKVCEQGALVL
jgi:Fe-S-cluster-containing hydrogenase component 2